MSATNGASQGEIKQFCLTVYLYGLSESFGPDAFPFHQGQMKADLSFTPTTSPALRSLLPQPTTENKIAWDTTHTHTHDKVTDNMCVLRLILSTGTPCYDWVIKELVKMTKLLLTARHVCRGWRERVRGQFPEVPQRCWPCCLTHSSAGAHTVACQSGRHSSRTPGGAYKQQVHLHWIPMWMIVPAAIELSSGI